MTDRLQLAENVNQRSMVEDYLNRVQIEPQISAQKVAQLQEQIKMQLIEKDAVLIAHYYTDPLIQALAEETGGVVSDVIKSLTLPVFPSGSKSGAGGCEGGVVSIVILNGEDGSEVLPTASVAVVVIALSPSAKSVANV